MSQETTNTIRGRVLMVMDPHFRLMSESGQVLLLTLGWHADASGEDLGRLRDEEALVEVKFVGKPGYDSARADSVQRC